MNVRRLPDLGMTEIELYDEPIWKEAQETISWNGVRVWQVRFEKEWLPQTLLVPFAVATIYPIKNDWIVVKSENREVCDFIKHYVEKYGGRVISQC